MSDAAFPPHAVAVVGLAGRFPDAPDLDAFWANIRDGHESLRRFSDAQIAAAGVPEAVRRDPAFVPKGTVLDDSGHFDAAFFGVSPGEAQVMDPQHRIFLEVAWEALEQAGYAPDGIEDPVGVYAGVSMNGYLFNHILSDRSVAEAAGGYQLMLGNDKDFLCTRVSYKLNLKGPSITVQTACSTSLVAVEMACRALARGECDMAMAGGVSLSFPETSGYLFQEGMIFSPDGHCRPFDAEARGTRAGAGAGIVVLKRLKDAVADGDTVHAVIRGAAINNDGAAKAGYTAPSIDGQIEAIAMAQTLAGVDPRSIEFIEAHGTATPLGDPIEIAALTAAFRDSTADIGFCRLGALKANIGHLDTAAGVAGLIKAILCLKHRHVPPLVNFRSPNPQLALETSPFVASAEGADWPAGPEPRRAGVSSFGIGGTNAHVVLEEGPAPVSAPAPAPQLLVLSARSEAALAAAATRLADRLEGPEAPALADAAFTLQAGRTGFAYRRSVVAGDPAGAAAALRRAGRPLQHEGGDRRIGFLFSGQGSQHARMGAGLYARQPVYRDAVDRCAGLLQPHLGEDLRLPLFAEDGAALDETRLTQPALFVTEYALATLWQSWGVAPAAMLGHSIGEYVAAHLAGVMGLEDALALVALRGRLMQAMAPGAMASVPLPAGEITRRFGDTVEVAAENAPELTAISGPEPAVEAVLATLAGEGRECRRLRTSHAFHSAMMEPAMAELEAAAAAIALSPPELPYLSNVTGRWMTAEEATAPGYYARHLRAPVRFSAGAAQLAADPGLFLLEVGPGTTLASLARMGTPAAGDRIASSLAHPREGRAEDEAMLAAAGRLWAAGVPLDWPGLHGGPVRPRRVPLPSYPFERTRHWVDPKPTAGAPAAPTAAPAPEASPGDPAGITLSAPSWALAPDTVAPAFEAEGTWLVLSGDPVLGAALGAALTAAGATATLRAEPAAGYEVQAPGQIRLRPAELEDFVAALDGAGPLAGVVIATDLAPDPESPQASFEALCTLARLIERVPARPPVRVLVVSAGGQSVLGEPVRLPDAALAHGPVLAINAEDERLQLRHLDLEAAPDPEATAAVIAEEAVRDVPELFSALRAGRRWVRRYEPLDLAEGAAGPPPLRDGGVYLITGGLGGVGLTLAKALAERVGGQVGEQLGEQVGARLVLTARSALPPREDWDCAIAEGHPRAEAIRGIRAVEAAGGTVAVEALEAADEAGLRDLVARTEARWGPIHGVIHAAGLPGSGALTALQNAEEIAATLAPKVAGLRALAAALGDRPLDFVALMSSINAVLPVPGAGDYAAANAFMDAWAESAERPAAWRRVAVFNWEGWGDVGMAARRAEEGHGADRALIPPEEAAGLFFDLLADRPGRVVVTPYDLAPLSAALRKMLRDGTAAATAARALAPAEGADTPPAGASLIAPERFDSDDERLVAAIWSELLGAEMEGPDENFFERGGHSLMATRVLARLDALAGVKLTLRDLFDAPVLSALALRVAQARGDGEPAAEEEREEFLI
ncbi:MAG: SDR family NAD(P)-dependent oxidoreductase [Pseudomonadota bacterium]